MTISGPTAYRFGAALALAAGLFQIWVNLAVGIVGSEDNPQNQGFFMVVLAALACSFVAQGRPPAMARAMVAVAGMQALLGLAIATAPITAQDPKGPLGVLILSGMFIALWLSAAALFHRSARSDPAMMTS